MRACSARLRSAGIATWARLTEYAEPIEYVQRTPLVALGEREVAQRAVGEQNRIGQSHPVDDVEPIGQQRAGASQLIALECHRGKWPANMAAIGLRGPASLRPPPARAAARRQP